MRARTSDVASSDRVSARYELKAGLLAFGDAGADVVDDGFVGQGGGVTKVAAFGDVTQ